MASVRPPVVRWLHHSDPGKRNESRYSYVIRLGPIRFGRGMLNRERAGFVAFDQYKTLLADADGKLSGPRTVIAGFGAGVTESLLAVTPTESIKTML